MHKIAISGVWGNSQHNRNGSSATAAQSSAVALRGGSGALTLDRADSTALPGGLRGSTLEAEHSSTSAMRSSGAAGAAGRASPTYGRAS